MARSADAWCPRRGLAAASPGGEKVCGLVALVAHPIPIPVELALDSSPVTWPPTADTPRWPPESLKDVGEDETLPGLPQDGKILCDVCEFAGGNGGDVLSTSDDCLSPDTVDVESTGGDSGLPRILEMLKDVYWGLQAGLSAGLPTSKLNGWW